MRMQSSTFYLGHLSWSPGGLGHRRTGVVHRFPKSRPSRCPRPPHSSSEWDKRRRPDPWFTTAFTGPYGTVVYLTQDVPEAVTERLGRAAEELNVEVIFLRRDDDANLLADALGRLGVDEEEIRLLHF